MASRREHPIYTTLDLVMLEFGDQDALAIELGVAKSTICRWLSRKQGVRQRDLHAVNALALKYGCNRTYDAAIDATLKELGEEWTGHHLTPSWRRVSARTVGGQRCRQPSAVPPATRC